MCDTGYVIRDHLPAIMQAISVDLAEKKQDIPLQLTRCYCTAVMMTHLLVDKVQEALHYCNHTSTQERSKMDENHSLSMATNMRDDAVSNDNHVMYYVLLTSYTSPEDKNDTPHYYFPGHVFVIEKVSKSTLKGDQAPFRLYQSYIGEYDLKKYMGMSRSDLHVDEDRMKSILDGLVMMMGRGKTWDDDMKTFWTDLTLTTDFTDIENMKIDGNIFFCYHKVDIADCNNSMHAFLERHLQALEELIKKGQGKEVYGVHNSKNNEYKPLDVNEMHSELKKIINARAGTSN